MSKNNAPSRSKTDFSQWMIPIVAGPLAGLMSLLFSILTLPHDLVWGDSPELAASAWVLGVPHPTGYPLYMLLTRLFQALPFGTVLFRAHLFSAVCSALTVWVLYSFLQRILATVFGKSDLLTTLPAFVASIAWSCTPIVWSQSRIAEVYGLFALQFALTLWLFAYAIQNPRKALPPLAFLIGTMLVHHRLSIFLIALVCVFIALRIHPRTVCWFILDNPPREETSNQDASIRWTTIILCLIAPLTLLAYLPLRALYDPAIDWYDPDTFSRFYQLISGKLYSGTLSQSIQALFQTPLASIIQSISHLFILPFLCYSVLAFPILWGVTTLRKKIHWLYIFTLCLFVMYQIFVFLYRVGDWQVFLLPSLTILTIPLAFGLSGILQFVQQPSIARPIVYLTAAFFLFSSLLPLWVRFDEEGGIQEYPFRLSNYTLGNGALTSRIQSMRDPSVTQYANQVWDQIPNGAPVITGLAYETADNELNPLLYLQVVEHRNPDSPLIGAGFFHLDWYRQQLSRKLSIELPPRQDQMFLSRDIWLETLWNELIVPALQRGPIFTTSFSITNPPPQNWLKRADFHYLGMIPIDRTSVSALYAPYIPGGHLYKISKKESKLNEDTKSGDRS